LTRVRERAKGNNRVEEIKASVGLFFFFLFSFFFFLFSFFLSIFFFVLLVIVYGMEGKIKERKRKERIEGKEEKRKKSE